MKRKVLKIGAAAGCCCLMFTALALTGCGSGGHQIIDSGTACTKCHDEKTTYDVADPSGAIQVSTTFTVETDADSIVVCTPTFISEDGSTCVPVMKSNVRVSDGKASVTVDEGVYAVAVDHEDSSTYKIVVAKASNAENTVSLK